MAGGGKRPFLELSQVLEGVLKQAGLGHLPHEEKLRRNWETLMGKKAATIASLDSLKGRVLRVKVESAVWRNELVYQREAIRKRANEILGAEMVKEVVLG